MVSATNSKEEELHSRLLIRTLVPSLAVKPVSGTEVTLPEVAEEAPELGVLSSVPPASLSKSSNEGEEPLVVVVVVVVPVEVVELVVAPELVLELEELLTTIVPLFPEEGRLPEATF
jgi:hypothetical protein